MAFLTTFKYLKITYTALDLKKVDIQLIILYSMLMACLTTIKQDHQRVMVDPILLIVWIYDWFRLVYIALIALIG